ncbi:YggS family pyridoxal phosphate-dependent enzyme [candidate division KSB1 bacterium]|nr:YggS family pyridoxal phosphate-dependent enzyme [candidate division KSB1 bacterium]RQW04216.1 MAG: YggS family pyridoxal phosphate-dependent enzyme [candidate division KSB1 bacterium]
MEYKQIVDNIKMIASTLPPNVLLEAAAKTRSVDQVRAAIEAGVSIFGYNYVQEAESVKTHIETNVHWHMIGHLQKNKVKKAVQLFDMIETIDSLKLAQLVDRECVKEGRSMDALVEINSGREAKKTGLFPDDVESLVRAASNLSNIRITGLMTMGPWVENPEELRPYFRETKKVFDHIAALNLPNVLMTHLSMGMSDSYRIAIEEGATIVRLGTILFGPRS